MQIFDPFPMPLTTGLFINQYSWMSLVLRLLGPLPVFDFLLWVARRVIRRKIYFVAGMIIGGCLVLGLSASSVTWSSLQNCSR